MLGSLIMIAIGCYYLIKFIHGKINKGSSKKEDKGEYDRYDKDQSGNIELRESFAFGFALSINNIGLGISASMAGLSVIAASVSSFVCSLVFICASNLFGESCISKFLGKYSEPISSALIILLGIYEMLA